MAESFGSVTILSLESRLARLKNHGLEPVEFLANESRVRLEAAKLCRVAYSRIEGKGIHEPARHQCSTERVWIVDEVVTEAPEEVVDDVSGTIVVAHSGAQRIRDVVLNCPRGILLLLT